MPKDEHYRAAEMHNLAAHAHMQAATHHGKEDHMTGHEYCSSNGTFQKGS